MVAPAPTEAQEREQPLVDVTVDQCVQVPGDAVRRMVALELGARLLSDADIPEAGDPDWVREASGRDRATRVTLGCGDPGVIRLGVWDPITGKSLDRRVEVGSVGHVSGRARLVALAVAELVQASWLELEVERPPESLPVVDQVEDDDARRVARDTLRERVRRASGPPDSPPRLSTPARPLDLRASVGLRLSGSSPPVAGALRLSVVHRTTESWAWSADVGWARGVRGTSLGDVVFDTCSVGLALRTHRRVESFRWTVGVGGRAQLVLRRGPPEDGVGVLEVSPRYTGGPLFVGSVEWAVLESFGLFFEAEAGWLLRRLVGRVGGEPEATMEGVWVGLSLGAAWRP
jgi:hypothetical protein